MLLNFVLDTKTSMCMYHIKYSSIMSYLPMTLTSISPETLLTSFSRVKEYVPLSGRTLGVITSSVNVAFVTMDTRSPVASSFSPKVHFAVGTG